MASRSLNKVMIIGNLTRDPEIRYTASGAALCSFGVATNRSWKNSDGEVQEEAEFHNLVSWNKMAEICYQLLAKGMQVYIEGGLRTRNWEDEKTGATMYKTEIKINEMILLDSRGKQGVGGGQDDGKGDDSDDVDDVDVDDVLSDDDSDSKKKSSGSKKKKDSKKDDKKSKKKSDKEDDPLEDDELPF